MMWSSTTRVGHPSMKTSPEVARISARLTTM
jgi:hypothetical protein